MKRRIFAKMISVAALAAGLTVSLIGDGLSSRGGYHYSNRVAVLEYHHIDPRASDYTLTPETFEKHLELLQANHYHVISMQEFIGFLQGRLSVPPDAVVITFDDGYESFYRYAYPILKKHGMVATNFLIISYLGKNPGIPFLTWDEIRTMKQDGFSFYSHTYNAHDFVAGRNGKSVDPLTDPIFLKESGRMETEEEYRQRVEEDLTKADDVLESQLGTQDKLLCLPHGRYNQTLLELSEEAGISYIFTGQDGLNGRGDKLIRRINAGAASPAKLMQKLNDETTLTGNLKIVLKNFIQSNRMSE
jgi:biofilm PGA synthesis lipoprotein PgaB